MIVSYIPLSLIISQTYLTAFSLLFIIKISYFYKKKKNLKRFSFFNKKMV